jgi:hypothetical protein
MTEAPTETKSETRTETKTESKTEAETREGGCHCGAVRYRVETDLQPVISCNCSICQKHGLLLTFVAADRFELLKGQDVLADYQFAKKKIHHQFCRHCGVESFGRGAKPDGTQMIAINVRCLDGIELDALTIQPVDGRSL